jgi:hypothetical protein
MANPKPPSPAAFLGRLGVLGGVAAGIVGLLISIACVAVPGLHFILGPFGPFIGGVAVGRFVGGAPRLGIAGVLTMAAGMATVAAAFTGALFGGEVSGWTRAAPAIVFFYTAGLAGVGTFLGIATAPRA